MVVEHQQVPPIVDCRRTVFSDDLRAQCLAVASVVGRQQSHRMPPFGGHTSQRQGLRTRKVARGDAQIRIRIIHTEGRIAAMNRQILQLHRPTVRNSRRKQRPVKPAIPREQLPAHEDLANNGVDEGRMHPVAPEIACPGEAVAEAREAARQVQRQTVSELHRNYFLSSPARRPVEKAIWRL